MLFKSGYGQIAPAGEDDGWTGIHYFFVPAIAYSSDLGLIGGGLGQRIDYGEQSTPFKNSMLLAVTASTKGMISSRFKYDHTRTFNSDIRSTIDVRVERFFNQNYFGIGNESGFNSESWDDDAYFYEQRELRLNYMARLPVISGVERGRLDLLLTYELISNNPVSAGEDTFFEMDRPFGTDGGWIHTLGTGLILENRNNEFDPRSGSRYEMRLRTSPTFLGDYGYGEFGFNARHYLSFHPDIVLAHQLDLKHTVGNVPFWNLPRIGSEYELRGYPENRFRGHSSWFSITEVRAWVWRIQGYDISFGLHGFWDTGRVFTDGDSVGDSFQNLKHTVGFGGAMTLFNPDIIFRGDVGFSEDIYRIYLGLGYLF